VFIIDIDIDAIYEEVDSVLDRIIDDNMTQLEQARAIHRWIARNIRYSYTRGGPPTIYEAAYRALRNRSGNCFNYYALAEIMLTRSDIPNMLIERIPGTPTTHRWNLINPDGLGWHHFDSAPTRIGFYSDTTLFTSGQAESYSRRLLELGASRNYYTYDPELYPEIAQ
jgi:transglutaminase-like putative cysteine protease